MVVDKSTTSFKSNTNLTNKSGSGRLNAKCLINCYHIIANGFVQIYSENTESTDTISWLVVAERTDPAVSESPLYDKNGNYKPEKFKQDYLVNKIQYLKNLASGSI